MSAATQGPARLAGSLLSTRRRWILWGLPGLFALAYALAVLIQLPSIISSIYLDSDTAIAPVIGHLAGGAPAGSEAVLGNHAWYEEYLFLRLTSGLSFYRQLWEISPLLWSIGGLALLGLTAWKALGRSAAFVVVCALACLGAFGRLAFLTLDWHGLTAVHTIILCGAVVWLAGRGGAIPWSRVLGLAVALGAFSALPASGDQVFLVWALAPLLVSAAAVAWRGPRRLGARMIVFALLLTAIALGGGAALASGLRAAGVVSLPFGYDFVSAAQVWQNLLLLLEGYANIGGGDFFGTRIDFPDAAVFASGVLTLGGLAAGLFTVRRLVVNARPRRPEGDPAVDARFAYSSFWTASLLTTSAAFMLTSLPVNGASARYLLGGYLAIGALLGLVALRGLAWRILVSAGVCVFALSGTYQVLREPGADATGSPEIRDSAAIERYAREEHVGYGYASYWNAPALTWATHFKLAIYPVQECGSGHQLCPGNIGISSWFEARPDTRSLLIVAPNLPELPITGLDVKLGPALAHRRFGEQEVYVFAYDIGSRLAQAPGDL